MIRVLILATVMASLLSDVSAASFSSGGVTENRTITGAFAPDVPGTVRASIAGVCTTATGTLIKQEIMSRVNLLDGNVWGTTTTKRANCM
jgi:hypothetical protein